MVSEKEAGRLEGWVKAAVGDGAKILCGGSREGTMFDATLLEDVPRDATLNCEEAFGPVAILAPVFREPQGRHLLLVRRHHRFLGLGHSSLSGRLPAIGAGWLL